MRNRSFGFSEIRYALSVSQRLDQRAQVFLAIARCNSALEDTGYVVGKFAADTGVVGLGLEALNALFPDTYAGAGMKTAKLERGRVNDLGQLPDSITFGVSGGINIQADAFRLA